MIGPSRRPRRRSLPPRRRRTATRRSYTTHRPGESAWVDRPISSDEVRRIASSGYPLWESIDVMQLRNRRITIAYYDLAERLCALLCRKDGRRDANWCTFATWSSMTIGTWIEDEVAQEQRHRHGHRLRLRLPRLVPNGLVAIGRPLVQRKDGTCYRCLAAGNRFVFLEIGLAVALFLESFANIDRRSSGRDDDNWTEYWDEVHHMLLELAHLDPSWLLTDAPEPEELRLGLRQYYEALFVTDPDERAELILAGNILIAAYEQRRVDGYVTASLALFTTRAIRNLVQHRSGAVAGWPWRWPSRVFARLMTRGLVLNTGDEQLLVSRPLPRIPGTEEGAPLFPTDLDTVTTPLLQALLTRYDLSRGMNRRRRVRDWTSFDERMNYITNLFRSRQQHEPLFVPPFPPEIEAALLNGRLTVVRTTDTANPNLEPLT